MDANPPLVMAKELGSSEKLLWSGRPQQRVLFRGSDAFLIPFSLLWCGFAVFWEASVIANETPFFFRLWGIPFVLVGLYMVFGRFIVEAKQRKNTFMALPTRTS